MNAVATTVANDVEGPGRPRVGHVRDRSGVVNAVATTVANDVEGPGRPRVWHRTGDDLVQTPLYTRVQSATTPRDGDDRTVTDAEIASVVVERMITLAPDATHWPSQAAKQLRSFGADRAARIEALAMPLWFARTGIDPATAMAERAAVAPKTTKSGHAFYTARYALLHAGGYRAVHAAIAASNTKTPGTHEIATAFVAEVARIVPASKKWKATPNHVTGAIKKLAPWLPLDAAKEINAIAKAQWSAARTVRTRIEPFARIATLVIGWVNRVVGWLSSGRVVTS